MPTESTATPDMTLVATFGGRHLSQFEETAENASSCFGSNFSEATLCLSHQLMGFLYLGANDFKLLKYVKQAQLNI